MNKGFVKIFEVILAISLIFVVINNIFSAEPPGYQEPQSIGRLNRYAGDIANMICYTPEFREIALKNMLPDNLTLRADAWNKSEGTEDYDINNNDEATVRQITYINRTASTIKLCITTANDTVEMNSSICERASGADCVPGTLSGKKAIPSSSTPGTICTEWFNYNLNKSKVYLFLLYYPDGDGIIYYDSGINGVYYKAGVDETDVNTAIGYTDYTSVPFAASIYALYDLDLNETLSSDLNYHMWLYLNNSNDGKLDDLINETGETEDKTTATSSCLISSNGQDYSPRKVVVGIWNKQ